MRSRRWLGALFGALFVAYIADTLWLPPDTPFSKTLVAVVMIAAPLWLIASIAYAVQSWRTRQTTGRAGIAPFIALVFGLLVVVARIAAGSVSRLAAVPLPVAVGLLVAVMLIASWPILRAGYEPTMTFRRSALHAVGTGCVVALFENRNYWLATAVVVSAVTFGFLKNRAGTSPASATLR